MSTAVSRRTTRPARAVRTPEHRRVFTPQPARAPVEETAAPSHRWLLLLGIPFVLGFAFFALAVGIGSEWPMVPAVVFGPVLLIATYLYLSLTSDSNTEG